MTSREKILENLRGNSGVAFDMPDLTAIKPIVFDDPVAQFMTKATTTEDEGVDNALSEQDKHFMEELYKLMEEELSNSELDVTRITKMLYISRTKLYYKIKGLTGETPSSFFRTYKLNRAAELLKGGKHTVAEIADMTGFSTQSHFSVVFKKQFGVTPTEYKG